MGNDDYNRVYKLIEDKYYEMKRNFTIAYRKSTGKTCEKLMKNADFFLKKYKKN
jgi:hypothetical protein